MINGLELGVWGKELGFRV